MGSRFAQGLATALWGGIGVALGAGLAMAELPSAAGAPEDLARGAMSLVDVPAQLDLTPSWDMPVPDAPALRPTSDRRPLVEVSDLRVVMTQLAILAGANDHLTLLQAQSADQALVLRDGNMTLADLAQVEPDLLVTDDAHGFVLRRPLIVWQGATLHMGAEDRLRMSKADGAFLLVFGRLTVDGATLSGTDDANPRSPTFRPFVLAVGSAEITIRDAVLEHLGKSKGGLFGGLAYLQSGLFEARSPLRITGSVFRDVSLVTVRQTQNAVLADNRFDGGGLEIQGGSGHLLRGNILTDSTAGIALQLTGGLRDSILQDTTILRPAGTGIGIAGLSRRLLIGGTLIDGAKGDGMSVTRASCLRLEKLGAVRGKATALRLVASGDVTLDRALFLGNRKAGIAVEDQPAGTDLAFGEVSLTGNGVGIIGWGSRKIALADVEVSGQFPRVFGGDLAPFAAAFLTATQVHQDEKFLIHLPEPQDAEPAMPLVLASSDAQPVPAAAHPFLPPGLLPWSNACLKE